MLMKAGVFSYKVRCFAMTGRVTIPWFQSQEDGLAPTRSPAHFNRSQVWKVGLPPLGRLHISIDHRSGRWACPRWLASPFSQVTCTSNQITGREGGLAPAYSGK